MPKLRKSKRDERNDYLTGLIVGQMARYSIDNDELAIATRCCEKTMKKKTHDPMTMTLDELFKVADKLHFTIQISMAAGPDEVTNVRGI